MDSGVYFYIVGYNLLKKGFIFSIYIGFFSVIQYTHMTILCTYIEFSSGFGVDYPICNKYCIL